MAQIDTLLAQKNYDKGIEILEKGDYSQAEIYLLNASKNLVKLYGANLTKLHNSPLYLDTQIALVELAITKGNIPQALEISEKTAPNLVPQSLSEARLLSLQAEIWLNKGQNEKALQLCQKAIELFQQKYAREKKDLAKCYNNLGLIYWNNRNQQLALEYLLTALEYRKQTFDPNHPAIASSYNNLGLVYSQAKNYEEASAYYQKVLQIYQKIYPKNHIKWASAYTNMGIIAWQQEIYPLANTYLQQALSIYMQNYGEKHPNIAFVYNYLAQLNLEDNNVDTALEYAQKALQIYQKNYGQYHPEIAKTYNLIGKIINKNNKNNRKKVEETLFHYQKALQANCPNFEAMAYTQNPPLNLFYNADVLLQSLLLKAQALEELYAISLRVKYLTQALMLLDSCDKMVEKIRQARTSKADKIALGETANEVYEDAIRLCLLLSEVTLTPNLYKEKAFYFSEKNRASVLLSAISESNAKSFANIPPPILQQEKELKEKMAALEQKLADKPDAETEKSYRTELFALNRSYEKFIKELEQKYPQYYALKYQVNFASAQDIKKVLQKDEVLISYFLANKTQRIFIFKITSKTLIIKDIPKKDNLEKYIYALRNGIKLRDKKTFFKYAYQLYQQLLPHNLLQNAQKVYIIPDGILSSIPFETFLLKDIKDSQADYRDGFYLLKKYAVSYAYSGTLFWQGRQKKQLGMDYDQATIFVCSPVDFEHKQLISLPATKVEATQISQQFTNRATLLLEEQAQELQLKKQKLTPYQFLHFATHGEINEDNPELSALFLRKDAQKQEDGVLYANEIYNLELNAHLVTLSACETGLGKINKGEGIIGLTRALLYAGAKNTLVSLWAVADISTANLMIDFYRQIQQNLSYSLAQNLQNAKIKMLDNPTYSAPYFWASFILIGQ